MNDLPGAEGEGKAIRSLSQTAGFESSMFSGDEAKEETLYEHNKEGILHFATHGFFLPTARLNVISNAMHRSGLALAGAQSTFESWGQGLFPDSRSDGILAAAEIAGMDMQKISLVVLSACESGVGESRSGEGVLGMRRGFIHAGSANLLMTLWPVSDQYTRRFMIDFYERLFSKGESPSRAVAKVQQEHLKKLRQEKSSGEAILLAGPFFVSGKQGF